MRNSCGLVAWLLAVILIHGCGDDSITDSNITPDEMMPLPGRIAFASDRDGDSERHATAKGHAGTDSDVAANSDPIAKRNGHA